MTAAIYHALIVEHDRSPRNAGPLPGATHGATMDNPLCGDIVTMRAIVDDARVIQVKFEARGCALCRASASLLSLRIGGAPLDEAGAVVDAFERFVAGNDADREMLGDLRAFEGARAVKARRNCVLLPFRALAKALSKK